MSESSRRPHEQGIAAEQRPQSDTSRQQTLTTPTAPVLIGETQAPPSHKAGNEGGYWPPSPEWALVVVTAILAVVTFFLMRYTRQLWAATGTLASEAKASADKTLAHLKESSERDQRGYVFYLRRVLEWQPTGMNIRFKNTGHTPVKNVEVFGYVSEAPGTHTGALPTTDRATESFKTVIAPHGELDVHFKHPLIERHFIESIALGGTPNPLYIHGQVKYTDAFGGSRTTEFRYRLEKNDLRNCAEGNDWD